MSKEQEISQFLNYLAHVAPEAETPHLPSLSELSDTLGVGISVLREQLEVAKALGLVEVRHLAQEYAVFHILSHPQFKKVYSTPSR